MRLYKVEQSDGKSDLHFFAQNFDHAAQQYVGWHCLQYGDAPRNFVITPVRRASLPVHEAEHLLAAQQSGLMGIGEYDPKSGWIIKPL